MPDDIIISNYNPTTNSIVILGVEFSNIEFPVDQNNQYINTIIGYEILRGSREGNRTIIAKGLINNMREYDIPDIIAGNNTGSGTFNTVTSNTSNYIYTFNNPSYTPNNTLKINMKTNVSYRYYRIIFTQIDDISAGNAGGLPVGRVLFNIICPNTSSIGINNISF